MRFFSFLMLVVHQSGFGVHTSGFPERIRQFHLDPILKENDVLYRIIYASIQTARGKQSEAERS